MTDTIKLKRAKSINDLYTMEFETLPFTGEWLALVGEPEPYGNWFVWGISGSGKTSFLMQLAKYLASLDLRVAYNSLEETDESLSLKLAVKRAGMIDLPTGMFVAICEPIDVLSARLRKQRSPDVVIFDSISKAQLTRKQYDDFKAEFGKKKLIVWVAHENAQTGHPKGCKAAEYILGDCDVKLNVDRYRVFPKSRYGGNHYKDVWPERAAELHDK